MVQGRGYFVIGSRVNEVRKVPGERAHVNECFMWRDFLISRDIIFLLGLVDFI